MAGALPYAALSSNSIVLSVGAKTYEPDAEVLALILHTPRIVKAQFYSRTSLIV